LDFCCLSANDDICTGSFYPLDIGGSGSDGSGYGESGVVRVVLPNDKLADEGNSKFVSTAFVVVVRVHCLFLTQSLLFFCLLKLCILVLQHCRRYYLLDGSTTK